MRRLFIDLETRSDVDLRKHGVYRYAASPAFRILLAAWALDDEPVTWARWEEAEPVLRPLLADPGVVAVAHNASFERVALSRALGVWGPGSPESFLDPSGFEDTAVMARRLGLPPALGPLTAWLGGEQKDGAGKSLILRFALPKKGGGGFTEPEEDPEGFREFGEYCRQDVVSHRDVWSRLRAYQTDSREEFEAMVLETDQRIADLGVHVDVPTCRMAEAAFEGVRDRAIREASALSGLANANSTQQALGWLRERLGDRAPENMQRATVAALLEEGVPEDVERFLRLRQESALTAGAKYGTFARMAVPWDDRLRGSLLYYGAQATGRWAAKGLNVQNMPHDKVEREDVEPNLQAIRSGSPVSAQTLKEMIRPMLVGPFVVSDFSQIEARVLATLAGNEATLRDFRDGKDLYTEVARQMGHGMERQHGKIATLALGYAGSVGALKAFGGGALGDDRFLLSMVRSWREAHPGEVALWYRLQDDLLSGTGWFVRDPDHKGDRGLRLPSGRVIWYRQLRRRTRMRAFTNYETGEEYEKAVEEITALDPANVRRRRVLTTNTLSNNLVQGTARDIQAGALVRLQRRGFRVVTHVHDEVVVEHSDPESVKDEVARIMSRSPSWLPDCPVKSEPYTCERYIKE